MGASSLRQRVVINRPTIRPAEHSSAPASGAAKTVSLQVRTGLGLSPIVKIYSAARDKDD